MREQNQSSPNHSRRERMVVWYDNQNRYSGDSSGDSDSDYGLENSYNTNNDFEDDDDEGTVVIGDGHNENVTTYPWEQDNLLSGDNNYLQSILVPRSINIRPSPNISLRSFEEEERVLNERSIARRTEELERVRGLFRCQSCINTWLSTLSPLSPLPPLPLLRRRDACINSEVVSVQCTICGDLGETRIFF